jgi:hypothetical protein
MALRSHLLWSFRDFLVSRVVADDEETSVQRRPWFGRIWRPQDRESLRAKRKGDQNAEGERLHIAVLFRIICAMKILFQLRSMSESTTAGQRKRKTAERVCESARSEPDLETTCALNF